MATGIPTVSAARAERDRARAIAICEAIGIDPNHTSEWHLEVTPTGTIVTWSGVKVLTDSERIAVATILGRVL